MRIVEITRRYHNDFHWIGRCEWCDHREHYGDGYADHFYCMEVVPNRVCDNCGSTSYEPSCSDRDAA